MKRNYIVLTAIIITSVLTLPLFAVEKKMFRDTRSFARAEIVKIDRVQLDENNTLDVDVQVHLKILDGPRKGESHVVTFRGDDNMPKEMFYREGDTVFIGMKLPRKSGHEVKRI